MTIQQEIDAGYGAQFTAGPIINQLNAYPRQWVKDGDQAVYGSIQPEMKDSLKLLSNWYKEGIIDPEIATRTFDQKRSLLGEGQTGIYLAPDFAPSHAKDLQANWVAVQGQVAKEGAKFQTHAAPAASKYLVIRKGYEHPEAVIRGLNVNLDYFSNNPDEKVKEYLAEISKKNRL